MVGLSDGNSKDDPDGLYFENPATAMTVILTTYNTWANRVLFNISKSKQAIAKRTRTMYSLEQERQSTAAKVKAGAEGKMMRR